MKKVIKFEGWSREMPEWEFDCPVYMVKPELRFMFGNSVGDAEYLVENYLIDMAVGGDPSDGFCDDYHSEQTVKRTLTLARKGKAGKSVSYWTTTIEIDTEDGDYDNIIEPFIIMSGHRDEA